MRQAPARVVGGAVRHAPHLVETVVGREDPSLGVDDEDPVGRGIERRPQQGDRLGQLALGALSRGDVEGDADDAMDRPVGVSERLDVGLEAAPPPVELEG